MKETETIAKKYCAMVNEFMISNNISQKGSVVLVSGQIILAMKGDNMSLQEAKDYLQSILKQYYEFVN